MSKLQNVTQNFNLNLFSLHMCSEIKENIEYLCIQYVNIGKENNKF